MCNVCSFRSTNWGPGIWFLYIFITAAKCIPFKWSCNLKSSRSLTLSLPNKLLSVKCLICLNLQSASMSLRVGDNVVLVSNSLDQDEAPSYSASHPNPSCLHLIMIIMIIIKSLCYEGDIHVRHIQQRSTITRSTYTLFS